MIGKVLILLISLTSMANVDCLVCFNCGYLELINGTKIPLTEEYGQIPFCNDFASSKDNTVFAKMVSNAYPYELLI